jgi:glycosyltransferase involved in cell wall biosynthesis
MKRILQINVTANWGSTGKIAEQIGLCAMKHNWESYIAYGRMSNPSQNQLIKVGSAFNVYEHYFESLIFDNEGLASRNATKRLLKQVQLIKPDIVHLHNIHDHYLNFRLLLKYLADLKIPVVWTQHDQWVCTGHCMYIPNACDKWQTYCHDCPLSLWYSLDRSNRNFKLKKQLISSIPSLTLVPVSNWLHGTLKQSYLKDCPVRVIHNGVDLKSFYPQNSDILLKLGIAAEKKIILGVAAVWDMRKGLKDFYELSRLLPNDEYAIIIVGKVPKDIYYSEGNCKITFIERTQDVTELAKIYSAADVFVNPTYQDNFPTTNIEALACGTPVITYSTGGSPEAVDERTGFVVPTGDVNSLVNAIIKVNKCEETINQCRIRAEILFDNEKCFEKYLELYNEILADKLSVVNDSNL